MVFGVVVDGGVVFGRGGRVDARALADYVDKIKAPPLLVMDPPRSGAGQKVMAALTRLQPERIIYVACDPAALARDLKVAVSHGYHITSLQAYDLFPTPTTSKPSLPCYVFNR